MLPYAKKCLNGSTLEIFVFGRNTPGTSKRAKSKTNRETLGAFYVSKSFIAKKRNILRNRMFLGAFQNFKKHLFEKCPDTFRPPDRPIRLTFRSTTIPRSRRSHRSGWKHTRTAAKPSLLSVAWVRTYAFASNTSRERHQAESECTFVCAVYCACALATTAAETSIKMLCKWCIDQTSRLHIDKTDDYYSHLTRANNQIRLGWREFRMFARFGFNLDFAEFDGFFFQLTDGCFMRRIRQNIFEGHKPRLSSESACVFCIC